MHFVTAPVGIHMHAIGDVRPPDGGGCKAKGAVGVFDLRQGLYSAALLTSCPYSMAAMVGHCLHLMQLPVTAQERGAAEDARHAAAVLTALGDVWEGFCANTARRTCKSGAHCGDGCRVDPKLTSPWPAGELAVPAEPSHGGREPPTRRHISMGRISAHHYSWLRCLERPVQMERVGAERRTAGCHRASTTAAGIAVSAAF